MVAATTDKPLIKVDIFVCRKWCMTQVTRCPHVGRTCTERMRLFQPEKLFTGVNFEQIIKGLHYPSPTGSVSSSSSHMRHFSADCAISQIISGIFGEKSSSRRRSYISWQLRSVGSPSSKTKTISVHFLRWRWLTRIDPWLVVIFWCRKCSD